MKHYLSLSILLLSLSPLWGMEQQAAEPVVAEQEQDQAQGQEQGAQEQDPVEEAHIFLSDGQLPARALHNFFSELLTDRAPVDERNAYDYVQAVARARIFADRVFAFMSSDQVGFLRTGNKSLLYQDFERFMSVLLRESNLFPFGMVGVTAEQCQLFLEQRLVTRHQLLIEYVLMLNYPRHQARFALETLQALLQNLNRRAQVMLQVTPELLFTQYLQQRFAPILARPGQAISPELLEQAIVGLDVCPDYLRGIIVAIIHDHARDNFNQNALNRVFRLPLQPESSQQIESRVQLIADVYRLTLRSVNSSMNVALLFMENSAQQQGNPQLIEFVARLRAEILAIRVANAALRGPVVIAPEAMNRLAGRLF